MNGPATAPEIRRLLDFYSGEHQAVECLDVLKKSRDAMAENILKRIAAIQTFNATLQSAMQQEAEK